MPITVYSFIVPPPHLAEALAAARARWAQCGVKDFRAHQAAEVLAYAASCFDSRMWGEPEHVAAAELGAWLAALAVQEDRERKAAAPPPPTDLGHLSPEEVQMIRAARAERSGR